MSKGASKIFNEKTAKLIRNTTQSSGSGPSLFCTKRFSCVKMLLPKSTSYFLFGISKLNKGNTGGFGFGANRFRRRP